MHTSFIWWSNKSTWDQAKNLPVQFGLKGVFYSCTQYLTVLCCLPSQMALVQFVLTAQFQRWSSYFCSVAGLYKWQPTFLHMEFDLVSHTLTLGDCLQLAEWFLILSINLHLPRMPPCWYDCLPLVPVTLKTPMMSHPILGIMSFSGPVSCYETKQTTNMSNIMAMFGGVFLSCQSWPLSCRCAFDPLIGRAA